MEKFSMYDRMMPNQEALLRYYKEDKEGLSQRIFEMCCLYSNVENVENEGYAFPQEFPAQQYMGTDPITRKLQCLLLKMINAKNVLEIGTFVGVSTIAFAKAVGDDGHVWTIEKYDKFAKLARENFKNFGCKNITLLEGDADVKIQDAITYCAATSSAGGGGIFDFVFLDGHKESYPEYFKLVWKFVRVGGIVMIDEGFFGGDVLNDEITTQKGAGVKIALECARGQDGANPLLLPLGAGVFIVIKE